MYQQTPTRPATSMALPKSENIFLRTSYVGAELRTNSPREGSSDAATLPSRFGDLLVAPSGWCSLNSSGAAASAADQDEQGDEPVD